MAKAAADFLAGRDITALFSSPLERARETAEPLAAQFGLEAAVDDRLIEPWNHFEGLTFGVGEGSLRRLEHWRYLRNPFLPSWGEPYRQVAGRLLAAMADARDAARGHEAVCVSHQLPIWVTRALPRGAQALAPSSPPPVRAGQRDQRQLPRRSGNRGELRRTCRIRRSPGRRGLGRV